MSASPSGIYLISSTSAEGVLFRHATGLSYDAIGIQYRMTVFMVSCATGQLPAWHPVSPPSKSVSVSIWVAWLPTQTILRDARWIAIEAKRHHEIARFIADVCLSRPTVWKEWSPALLGTLLELPAVPVPLPKLPLSLWENLVQSSSQPPTTPTAVPLSSIDHLSTHMDTWIKSMEKGIPPIIDLNSILNLLQRPPLPEPTSASAVVVVMPTESPRMLTVPEASGVLSLWHPCLDGYSFQEIEKLNFVLHSPDFLHQGLYDELRDACQKKLSAPTKRWPTHS